VRIRPRGHRQRNGALAPACRGGRRVRLLRARAHREVVASLPPFARAWTAPWVVCALSRAPMRRSASSVCSRQLGSASSWCRAATCACARARPPLRGTTALQRSRRAYAAPSVQCLHCQAVASVPACMRACARLHEWLRRPRCAARDGCAAALTAVYRLCSSTQLPDGTRACVHCGVQLSSLLLLLRAHACVHSHASPPRVALGRPARARAISRPVRSPAAAGA